MAGPPCGNNPRFCMSPGDRAVVEQFMDYLADRRAADEEPEPVREEDPFGPWEFVEADDRCRGHGDGCMWSHCTGRESTCRCMCPVCLGETPQDYGFDGDY